MYGSWPPRARSSRLSGFSGSAPSQVPDWPRRHLLGAESISSSPGNRKEGDPVRPYTISDVVNMHVLCAGRFDVPLFADIEEGGPASIIDADEGHRLLHEHQDRRGP